MVLFKRINGSPMEFHLANLPDEYFEKYSNLIRSNGGKVKTEPDEKVLTFTLPSRCYVYLFVFDVKFIEDCVQSKQILNVDNYFIGDSRLTPKCKMSKLALGTDTCLCCFFIRKDLEAATVKKLENLSLEETQGSGLKSNPPPLLSEESTSKENDLVSNSSHSENISIPRSRSESVSSRISPESIIAAKEVNESKTNISKSPKSSTNSKRSSANAETPVSDAADYEIPKSPILSSEKSAVKSESVTKSKKQNSKCEHISKPISKPESVNLKSLPEAFVLLRKLDESQLRKLDESQLRKLDESQLRKSEVVFKCEPLVAEESSISEFEASDMEDESSDSKWEMQESDSEPSTSKFVPKRQLGKRHPRESNEPTEELIQWAKEITKKRKKDQYGYPIADSIYYHKWEKQAMVDFLIKTKKIDVSGGPNVWQLAYNLKLFPKCRSYNALRSEFRSNILPNIESYNLSPNIEAQFIKTRHKVEEASEELKAWAKEVTKNKKKDNFGCPVGGKKMLQWEKKMILDFLIESNKIDSARLIETWELAYSLKIFPHHRRSVSLQKYFIRIMLPCIENFKLPQNIEARFLKLRKPSVEGLKEPPAELKAWAEELMKDKKAEVFEYKKITTWELDAMVQYLIRANIIEKARMKNTWELAFKLKIFSKPRTCDFLLREFRRLILPKIEDYKLPAEIEAKFVKLRQAPKNSRKVEISEEVKAWAVQVMRNRKKDAFGFPVELKKSVQSWEKRVMLDFVVKMERIDLAKAPNFWDLAYQLKIVPKQRTRFTSANTFTYHILPNIESYHLSPEIEAEFIRSRTVADIKRVPRKKPKGLDISIS